MYINEITTNQSNTNNNNINNNQNNHQNINNEKFRTSPSTSSDSGVHYNEEESSLNHLYNNNNNSNKINNETNEDINLSVSNVTAEITLKNNDLNIQNNLSQNEISNSLNEVENHQETNTTNTNNSISTIDRDDNINVNYNLNDIQQKNDNNNTSPSTSINSNRISIVSIDDDGIESSVIDSDEDYDDPDIISIGNNRNYIIKKLSERIDNNIKNDGVIVINQKFDDIPSEGAICTSDGNSIIKNASSSNGKPQIGSIAVQNSTDITFGNKTFYQGPVTIKQFVLEKKKDDTKPDINTTANGKDNLAFDCDQEIGEINQRNNTRYNLNTTRGYLSNKLNLNTRTAAISGAIVLLILLISAIVFTVQAFLRNSSYKNSGDGDDSRKNIPINSTIGNDNISDGRILRIVTRDEWIAQPPMNELTPLEIPTHRVIIAHTATEGCNTQASCVFRVRYIQTFHIESRNFDDIAYNFLVGGDGAVYEGRGWDKQGAHTKGYNVGSICVAFIGTFIQIEPPEKQLRAAKLIIEEGVRLGKLKSDYKLYGHRQLIASESPGEALYKIIQKWPHWTNELQ